MKAFSFRLQKFLDLRHHLEKEKQFAFSRLAGECELLRQEIVAKRRVRLESFASRLDEANDRRFLDPSTLGIEEHYESRLRNEEAALGSRLEVKKVQRAEAEEAYRAAMKDRKVMEALRDKKASEYRKIAIAEEMGVTDEVNNAANARKEVS